MKKAIKILDYVFLLRLTLFYPIWTFFLAGCWGGSRLGKGIDDITHSVESFWVAVSLTLLMGSIYILNQIQDVETDRINKKCFHIADGIISVKEAYIEAILLAVVSLGFGFWVDLRVGIEFAFLFFLFWLYSFPPARWKNRPFMGLFSNGMLGFICYSLGWIAEGGGGLIKFQMFAYFFACSAVYLNTTLPDIEGDRKTKKMTIGVKYGVRKTVVWALILEIITVLMAFFYKDWLLFFASIAVFPLFLMSTIRQSVAAAIQVTKLSVMSLTLAVCVFFPLYILPVFGVFFLSRWYYKKRFDFDYPSFKSE